MSRQRSYTNGFNHRLRSDKPFYQASDSEIKADLKKLDYLNPPKKEPEIVVIPETLLPKKREAQVEDLEYVIDGLVKLMTAKPKEVKKKSSPVVEKKPENPPQTINPYIGMIPYFSLQNPLLWGYPNLMQNSFSYPSYSYPAGISISSSADMHIKAARYTLTKKSNC